MGLHSHGCVCTYRSVYSSPFSVSIQKTRLITRNSSFNVSHCHQSLWWEQHSFCSITSLNQIYSQGDLYIYITLYSSSVWSRHFNCLFSHQEFYLLRNSLNLLWPRCSLIGPDSLEPKAGLNQQNVSGLFALPHCWLKDSDVVHTTTNKCCKDTKTF